MDFFQVSLSEFSIIPKVLFYIGDFPVTSTMTTGLLLNILLIVLVILFSRKLVTTGVPSRVQLALESLYSYILDLTGKITGDKAVANQIIVIIISIMLYVGLSNIFMVLPVIGSLTYEGKLIFETTTKDLNITLGVALTVVIWTHILSIRKFNAWNHFNKFIRINAFIDGLRKGKINIFIGFIDLFLGLLDIISEFAKSLSLSLRLFGNMFAGEVLTALILALFAIVLPVPIILYGVFIGGLQALVFGALSASYFSSSLKS
jgi:F-type H+-transporting ATPase subunit a